MPNCNCRARRLPRRRSGFRQRLAIVFLEGAPVLGGHAVVLAGLVGPLQEPHGEGVAVDEHVLKVRLELLLVRQAGHDPGAVPWTMMADRWVVGTW